MTAPTRRDERATSPHPHSLKGVSVPLFWPMAAAASLVEQGLELYGKNLKFVAEEIKIHHEARPRVATPNRVMLDLRTMVFRDYSAAADVEGLPAIVVAPYAGHSAVMPITTRARA